MEVEYLALKVEELEKRLNERQAYEEKAKIMASAGIDERLRKMNEFREQLDRQAAKFIDRDDHEKLEDRVKALESFKDNFTGRFWALGAGLSFLLIVLQIVMRVLKV